MQNTLNYLCVTQLLKMFVSKLKCINLHFRFVQGLTIVIPTVSAARLKQKPCAKAKHPASFQLITVNLGIRVLEHGSTLKCILRVIELMFGIS